MSAETYAVETRELTRRFGKRVAVDHLDLKVRVGELYGEDAIVGDVLICQERRTTFWVDELRGFTEEEAERLRDLLFRQTGRGRG